MKFFHTHSCLEFIPPTWIYDSMSSCPLLFSTWAQGQSQHMDPPQLLGWDPGHMEQSMAAYPQLTAAPSLQASLSEHNPQGNESPQWSEAEWIGVNGVKNGHTGLRAKGLLHCCQESQVVNWALRWHFLYLKAYIKWYLLYIFSPWRSNLVPGAGWGNRLKPRSLFSCLFSLSLSDPCLQSSSFL